MSTPTRDPARDLERLYNERGAIVREAERCIRTAARCLEESKPLAARANIEASRVYYERADAVQCAIDAAEEAQRPIEPATWTGA